MRPTIYRLRNAQVGTEASRDRQFGHRLVTSMLPSALLASERPRAAAGTLWRADPEGLTISSRVPLISSDFRGLVEVGQPPVPERGDRLRLSVQVEASHTVVATVDPALWDAGVRPRGQRVALTERDAPRVIGDRLRRAGMEPETLTVSPVRRVRAGRKSLPTADVTAEVTVTDEIAADTALCEGLGRGRSYGLSLIYPLEVL